MSETVRAAAAVELAKHRKLITSVLSGRILSALMLPMLRWAPPAGYGVLTTTGRRTGRRRSRCVRIVRAGDRAYVVALRPPKLAVEHPDWVNGWVHNIRAEPAVSVRLPGGSRRGRATEITDPAEYRMARALLAERVYLVDFAECAIHLRGLPSKAKILGLHRYWFDTGNPVRIDLADCQTRSGP
ncbi:nitroreductase/quinone reductase family protein [Mycolicibacterium sp. HK-90]|uniref:nitroreductase/quinone reductase family protein n=1 Tax=Mycolicibacterium sp. HK-90 TaxID=3056937 RepID=UPI00265B6F64|nr:nitroreductase/quinone reductase family protein [Mycolicibacterium sp. HK-90]WKG05090.1 nitroreductase/quinone reductase family protein [Mycolicibacterium sp. HK-90]